MFMCNSVFKKAKANLKMVAKFSLKWSENKEHFARAETFELRNLSREPFNIIVLRMFDAVMGKDLF